jgi:hypothetical protein
MVKEHAAEGGPEKGFPLENGRFEMDTLSYFVEKNTCATF